MSDTPRTNKEAFFPHDSKYKVCDADFARTLERELAAANTEIEEKRKDVVWLATEKAKLENYVMRLEEELMDAKNKHAVLVADVVLNEDRAERIKQLEDRIHRASMAFFEDVPDCQVASGMLAILEEERRKQ